jgi:alkyl hydroperoxide reductase subunit D
MPTLEALRESLPDAARDLKVNLQTVLGASSLTDAQKWGVAYASAIAARHPALRAAILAEARQVIAPEILEDARAAAAVMGMNNVFYRSRHMLGKPSYETMPARLRMQKLGSPAGSKLDFELMSLAVSAVNGCEVCLTSHERVVIDGGLSEQQVFDAVRLAAVIHGVAVALEMGDDLAAAAPLAAAV